MSTRLGLALLAATAFAAITAPALADDDLEFHAIEGAAMPFSEAVRVGDLLYLSGMLGNMPGTAKLVPGGIQAETRQTLEHIKAVVEKHGSTMDRVFKCTVFLADMAEWGAMNEVYVTFFPNNKPARSALGASGLALGARVEIECIAHIDD